MFPPVNVIPKYSAVDTILSTQNRDGLKRLIPIPRNTRLLIHTTGLHFNRTHRHTDSTEFLLMLCDLARYWKDPDIFNPMRFLDPDWPRNAFIPFGAGRKLTNPAPVQSELNFE